MTFGCATYQFGARSLYAPDIQTVYVPVFESDSLRRFLGEWLTEAVAKEIENRTNYKVIGDPGADSILTGRIIRDRKRALSETEDDDVRALEFDIVIEVAWANRAGQWIREPQYIAMPPELIAIGQTSTMIPEVGQSITSAEQVAITRLAEQIVEMMEKPW
jgi:hypothetical protein